MNPIFQRIQQAFQTPFTDHDGIYQPTSTEVHAALHELREIEVSQPQLVNSTLNGTQQLLSSDNTVIDVHCEHTGFTVKLPNATTIPAGRRFQVINDGTQPFNVTDFDGNLFVNLLENERVDLYMQHQTGTAGEWIYEVNSLVADGIKSYVEDSVTTFVTSSTSDDLITDMVITPEAGRYLALFTASCQVVSNNRIAEYVFYVGGSFITNTRRTKQGVGANFQDTMVTFGELNCSGTDQVDVRANITFGNLILYGRTMALIKLGPYVI